MAYIDPAAGAAREGAISTAALDPGVLAASALGRALMADDFFNAATALAKFAADSIANAFLLKAVADGAFAADAATRALFADQIWTTAKLAPRTNEAHTAGDTLLAAETGTSHTNTGASGTITIILPAATVGQEFYFGVGAAQELRLDPAGSETISLPSTGVAGAAGKYLVADAIGESVHLMCVIAGTWAVMGYTGTWTAEA